MISLNWARNRHVAQPALVLGSGCSLLHVPKAVARDVVVIACNDAVGLVKQPDYFFTSGPRMVGGIGSLFCLADGGRYTHAGLMDASQ